MRCAGSPAVGGLGAVVGVQLRAHQREQVGRIGLIEHREVRVEAEGAAVAAEHPVADGVERAAPHATGHVLTGEGLGPTALGIGLGVVLSVAATRVLASILYGVNVHDPIVFVATAAALGLVAVIASYAPALRASAIDPIISLRSE